MERWKPRQDLTKREKVILKRTEKRRRLFTFLRLRRVEIFDDEFQAELEGMYRDTGAGGEATPPAFLCMVLLLQGYLGVSDADAVDLSVVDARWQMVLDCLGADEATFSQGALQQFRERLIRADMDRRLLERTVELAKKTNEFDWKKLPKNLRVAIDSRPFEGAGRVEDTFNLLGHAARKIAECAAELTDRSFEEVCRLGGMPLLLCSSIKAGLDVNWNDGEQKDEALNILTEQLTSLHVWVIRNVGAAIVQEPLRPYIEALIQVQRQDLEKAGDDRVRICQGVAEDRRVSIEDPDMRHGRKSKSKRFNGYKQHIAADIDTDLIVACAVTPANRPEEEATPALKADIEHQNLVIGEVAIDRAYVNSTIVSEVLDTGGNVFCKPWALRNNTGLFSKADFKIDLRKKSITCPAGQIEQFEMGDVVEFDPEVCGACPLRGHCTLSASGRGRTVKIAEDERLQKRLRKLQATSVGRAQLRKRTGIEHRLAHIAARQGPRARYKGTRKNVYDLRRMAVIQNLETIDRRNRDGINRAA
jgi:hypothetical protein